MPTVTGMDGCMGMSMLVNRETGRGIATTSWMSEDEMRARRGQVSAFRSPGRRDHGRLRPTVDEWEIAVMHREHEAREGSWCRVTWLRCPPAEVEATPSTSSGTRC